MELHWIIHRYPHSDPERSKVLNNNLSARTSGIQNAQKSSCNLNFKGIIQLGGKMRGSGNNPFLRFSFVGALGRAKDKKGSLFHSTECNYATTASLFFFSHSGGTSTICSRAESVKNSQRAALMSVNLVGCLIFLTCNIQCDR